jgi:alkyl hydroperoxide reductase subunit AhpC
MSKTPNIRGFFVYKIGGKLMCLMIGDDAPNFKTNTTLGEIEFHEWLGDDWGVFMSHPSDFTPVCTTEIGRVSSLINEFNKRNTKVLVVSVGTKTGMEPLESHKNWIKDVNETQNVDVTFPLAVDPNKQIANLYGLIHPNASDILTIRSVFIISPDKKIKLIISYPASTGRNFIEILRVLDSLQLTSKYQVATPADWEQGSDCIIIPTVSTDEIPVKFPKGHTIINNYLRITPQPDI